MNMKFTKMHGIGNDFVVLDGVSQSVSLNNDQLRFLADRHFGIGCDQILLVECSDNPAVDFRYRIFNADGGEVEQCGNGARCFARFVREKGLTKKSEIRVETKTGQIVLHVTEDEQVRVDMGAPCLEPAEIPLNIADRSAYYRLTLNQQVLQFGAVSMGNPHAVFEVSDVNTAEVEKLGENLQSHDCFPQRANIGFMQMINRTKIKLRVYERGAGETLACGTGACAAVVVGQLWGKLDSVVTVCLPGGDLRIEWRGGESSVWLSGPASFVFEGEVAIPPA
ncbi:MAG TPA: diaminopimelate epimerase [Gammaproteobacteria bacterium]|nr:diaminopimelate epimerase [Gammaproteobacteria bacterium]